LHENFMTENKEGGTGSNISPAFFRLFSTNNIN